MEPIITDFNENGFSILQGVLESETLEAAKHECEALVEALALQRRAEQKLTDIYPDAPFETRMIQLYAGYTDENPDDLSTRITS